MHPPFVNFDLACNSAIIKMLICTRNLKLSGLVYYSMREKPQMERGEVKIQPPG